MTYEILCDEVRILDSWWLIGYEGSGSDISFASSVQMLGIGF